jgi:Domain of unknown function (DUF1707)/2TM domain
MTPEDSVRIGDEERERAVAQLHEHAARGRLDPEELDERVERALQARTRSDLAPLLRDLPAARHGTGVRRRPRRDVAGFKRHLGLFAVMALFFVVLWALSGGGSFWPAWAVLGWGIAIGIHGVKLLWPADDEDNSGGGGERDALPRGT